VKGTSINDVTEEELSNYTALVTRGKNCLKLRDVIYG
jgi:hypothetical protein